MKRLTRKSAVLLILTLSVPIVRTVAQSTATTEKLSPKQTNIIVVAALTANGQLLKLKPALHEALDAGLKVNEIKEVIVHLYAYCGFPRSIRSLQVFMEVLDERKAKGIKDKIGAEASPIANDGAKYERGKNTLQLLTGISQSEVLTGYSAFAPVIDQFLKEHLFADIFDRDILTHTERELVTISVLSSIGGVEPMLRSHFDICLNVGLAPKQLQQFIAIIKSTIGINDANAAQNVLDQLLKSKK